MTSENNSEMINSLRLAIRWKDFRQFCLDRSTCRDCPYLESHVCSISSTEKVLSKVAESAREYLKIEGLMI